jgi:transcriptional regulator with XRE-family HTH domain
VISQKVLETVCANTARILREERERQGASMTSVAEQAGLSQQMVSYVERGLRKPNLDTLLRIAWALKVDPADVLRKAQKS